MSNNCDGFVDYKKSIFGFTVACAIVLLFSLISTAIVYGNAQVKERRLVFDGVDYYLVCVSADGKSEIFFEEIRAVGGAGYRFAYCDQSYAVLSVYESGEKAESVAEKVAVFSPSTAITSFDIDTKLQCDKKTVQLCKGLIIQAQKLAIALVSANVELDKQLIDTAYIGTILDEGKKTIDTLTAQFTDDCAETLDFARTVGGLAAQAVQLFDKDADNAVFKYICASFVCGVYQAICVLSQV
ncbi:MAG: hypothetical protein PHX51_05115 [Clostridia bacterium]|nr:hypothetical protein [Clostridia bacterium]